MPGPRNVTPAPDPRAGPRNPTVRQFPQAGSRSTRGPGMLANTVSSAQSLLGKAKNNFFNDKNDPNHWWNRSAALDFFDRLLQKIDASTVSFSHSVTVTVQGGPQADLRRVWYLALAAAFGRYRNRVASVQQCEMQAQWDVTAKRVTVSIGYSCGGWAQGAQQTFGSGLSSPVSLFHRGPDQVTIGGSWPAWTTTTAGAVLFGATAGIAFGRFAGGFVGPKGANIGTFVGGLLGATGAGFAQQASAPNLIAGGTWTPVFETNDTRTPETLVKFLQNYGVGARANLLTELPSDQGGTGRTFFPWERVTPALVGGVMGSQINTPAQMPGLPDDGRVITTGQKLDPRVQNPRPPLDGKSRAGLVSLVAAALGSPGFLPARPPTGLQPLASPGLYLYPPGQGLDDIALSNQPFQRAVQAATTDFVSPVATTLASGVGPDGYGTPVNNERIPNARG